MSECKRIGLTGGIGSGKSVVAEMLAEAGVTVIDLDRIGRELSENDPAVVSRIAEICGQAVLVAGKLDRGKVREAIFSDPVRRRGLEEFLHPLIWLEFEEYCRRAKAQGKRLVVCEAALILETGLDKKLDGLVLVTAEEGVRRDRVMSRDRISARLAEKMIRSQFASPHAGQSTVVIQNQGSLEDLQFQVRELIASWRELGLA